MFRKIFSAVVILLATAQQGSAGGVEFDVAPTRAPVDPGVLAPFMWTSPVMNDDAAPISLSWSALAVDENSASMDLQITPLVSVDVNGQTRAIIGNITGKISIAGGEEWTIHQANFGNSFAFSAYIRETSRLSFLIPVKLVPVEKERGVDVRSQLLVTCQVNKEASVLSCDPPRIDFLGGLKQSFPSTPTGEELFERKTLPLRLFHPSGFELVEVGDGFGPRLPPDNNQACCHNMYYTNCKCLLQCPVGDSEPNCKLCTSSACGDCHHLFGCLNNCS